MKILLAEDEKALADAVALVLRHYGYEVDVAQDGIAALERVRDNVYDCMVFDIMMPWMDGIELLRHIRRGGDVTPVLMLTAKAEVDDRITGLDAGADDYLTKPFAMGELLARIRALTRRAGGFTPDHLSAGNTTLDVEEQELSAKSAVRLSSREAKLMKLFLLNAGKSLTADELLGNVWKDEPGENVEVVWMYVSYLREKLESIGSTVFIRGAEGGPYGLFDEPEGK